MNPLDREIYVMKLMLVLMRDRKARQGQVRSVGYMREYGELPEELGVSTLNQLSNEELLALAQQIGIKNRPAIGKSDIYMNDLGYMLISTKQAVTIVDKLSLQELKTLVEQHGSSELKESMISLDNLMKEQINDDEVEHLITSLPPFVNYRDQWNKLLSFILCNGTTPSTCRFPAEYVLRYADPINMNSWDIFEPDTYIAGIWDELQLTIFRDQSISIALKMKE